jgi:hypothetical protein
MYKVIFFDPTTIGGMEDQLNDVAEMGYKVVGYFQTTSRMLVIMERQAKAGRPSKKEDKEEETKLGD